MTAFQNAVRERLEMVEDQMVAYVHEMDKLYDSDYGNDQQFYDGAEKAFSELFDQFMRFVFIEKVLETE